MSKEEIYNLIELFGLSIDYDQWDVEGKNWIRVKSLNWPKDFGYTNECLILYKDDGRDIIIDELRQSLIHMGENIRSKVIRKLLNLE